MSSLDNLRKDYETADAKAQKLMADKDNALQTVRDRYGDRLRAANDAAAHAQKALNDAEAAHVILDRLEAAKAAAPNEQAAATAHIDASKTLRSLNIEEAAVDLGVTPPAR